MRVRIKRFKRRWDRWRGVIGTPWFFYNVLVLILEWMATVVSLVSSRVGLFLEGRRISSRAQKELFSLRQNFQNCVICFISSAGEYEQALPVLERLEQKYSLVSVLIFFSNSGMKFAQKRGEKRPYICAPIDRTTTWQPLLTGLRPDVCLVVRHELWPAFLWSAQQLCPIFLIDITTPHHQAQSGFKHYVSKKLKHWLYGYVSHIMAVEEIDAQALAPYVTKSSRLQVVGDTKYDRVIERMSRFKGEHPDVQKLKSLPAREPLGLRFFIIGSAWQQDVEVVCQAYKEFMKARRPARDWRIIIVPHDLSKENLQLLNATVARYGLSSQTMSQGIADGNAEAIIADKMGILAELYAVGHMALIGGAFHHRVHNVLEPAAHGLYIACGPRYKTSREAISLVEQGLLKVVNNDKELCAWWQQVETLADERHLALVNFLQQQCGAANRIVTEIEKYLVRR